VRWPRKHARTVVPGRAAFRRAGYVGANSKLDFLDAHLGCLFDVWVHEFGQPRGVDGVLVDAVELGLDTTQYCPEHVAR
jgi:hypothetical protein